MMLKSQPRNPLQFNPIAVREYDLSKLMLGTPDEQKAERAKRDGMSDKEIESMYADLGRTK